jgi:hypothetical protein
MWSRLSTERAREKRENLDFSHRKVIQTWLLFYKTVNIDSEVTVLNPCGLKEISPSIEMKHARTRLACGARAWEMISGL